MEVVVYLLAIINGVVLTVVAWFAYGMVQVRKQYEGMLQQQSRLQNQQTVQIAQVRDDLKTSQDLLWDIQTKMEKDEYKAMTDINTKITAIEQMVETHAKKWDSHVAFEKRVAETFTQQKQQIKNITDNPNLIRRY